MSNSKTYTDGNTTVSVVTVDGPSGAGKGTIAQKLAVALGMHFLDSGALYRLVAFAAIKYKIALDNETQLAILAASMDVKFIARSCGAESNIVFEGAEVSNEIRTESCGNSASLVAAFPAVRAALLQRQRDFAELPGLVADGRDMGTVVFPEAQLKFFLTASAAERAKRRHQQLKDKGMSVTLDGIFAEIERRDERDRSRAVAPLVPAKDAQVLDTTGLSIDEVFVLVLRCAKGHPMLQRGQVDS